MQATPLFLGACALASVAGVVGGTTINTRPIQRGGIGMDEIVRPAIAIDPSDTGLSEQVALPDHYALDTPEGHFGVAELTTRGINAQRRYGWREAVWVPPPEPNFAEPVAEPGWSYGSQETEQPIIEPAEMDGAPAEPPVQLADASSAGEARVIDVAAELASN